MIEFKKFTGNYIDVIKALQLPASFYGTSDRKTYTEQIKKDLHRICYVNFSGNVTGMQERLVDSSHLADHDLSYTQGDFYGGVFTENTLKLAPTFIETVMSVTQEGSFDGYSNNLAFTYDDDKGRHCGVSLSYLRDDSDLSIKVEERPLRYALAIIRNVNLPLNQREVFFWTHSDFLCRGKDAFIPCDTSIDGDKVAKDMQEALHSKSIHKLLAPVLQRDGSINLAEFNALNNRLITNQNIDDRDLKLNKLLELYTPWLRLLADPSGGLRHDFLLRELNSHMVAAFSDVNFFKNKSLEEVEALVVKYKNHPIIAALPPVSEPLEAYALGQGFANFEEMQKEMNQSFLKRNQADLIVLGVATLACLSLALASVILLPLAPIAFAAGVTALTAALSIREDVQQKKVVEAINYHGFMKVKKPKEESPVETEDLSLGVKSAV